ncbi:hypothetical protein EOM86_00050 [Candidatus Nomurabacteria bacterium]|nr:hypothetical protein [Candidatus Nomurabacteria bacterium]
MTILEALKNTNIKNRVDRRTLARLTQLNDRVMREQIHDLRMKGHRIIGDTSSKGGYFMGTPAEWDAFCEQQRSRAINNFYRKSNEPNEKQVRLCI